jgi:hypothetical protein
MNLGTQKIPAIIQKALHVPDLHGNLLSVSNLTNHGLKVIFEPDNCQIFNKTGKLIGKAYLRNNLYVLDAQPISPERIYISAVDPELVEVDAVVAKAEPVSKANAKIWHRRLGHINIDTVMQMVRKEMVKGMSLVQNQKDEPTDSPCEPCLHGKQTRKPIPTETHDRKQMILVRIFSDVCGKMQTPLRTGNNYFVTFIDDASRILNIAFLKQKSEVLRHFKAFVE